MGNGVADDTVAFQACYDYLTTLGGGVMFIPPGVFPVDQINCPCPHVQVIGSGPLTNLWKKYATIGNYTFNVDFTTADQPRQFRFAHFTISGDPANPMLDGFYLNNTSFGTVEDIYMIGLNKEFALGHVYGCKFTRIYSRLYNVGFIGTEGKAANNNTLDTCMFYDGNLAGTAVPILDYCMGYTTFINCDFEGTLISHVDLSQGSGFNVMVGCRMEQLKAGGTWLKLGSNNIIDCKMIQSAAQQSYPNFMIEVSGKNNKVNGVLYEYPKTLVYLLPGSADNDIMINVDVPFTEASPNCQCPVLDQGANNTIHYGPNDHITDNTISRSDVAVSNYIRNSHDQSGVTLDGLTKAFQTGQYGAGPFMDGNVYLYNTPIGAYRAYWEPTGLTAGYYYTFSFYAMATAAGDTITVIAGDNATDESTFAYPLRANLWTRFTRIFKATTTTAKFGFRIGAGTGLYVAYPQVCESKNVSGQHICIPGGYVPTAGWVGVELAPDYMRNRKSVGAPYGSFSIGDRIGNLVPAVGSPKGWVCTVAGTPGTMVTEGNL